MHGIRKKAMAKHVKAHKKAHKKKSHKHHVRHNRHIARAVKRKQTANCKTAYHKSSTVICCT